MHNNKHKKITKFKSAGKFVDDEGNTILIEFDNNVAIVRYKILYTALLEQVTRTGLVYNSQMKSIKIPKLLLKQIKEYMHQI